MSLNNINLLVVKCEYLFSASLKKISVSFIWELKKIFTVFLGIVKVCCILYESAHCIFFYIFSPCVGARGAENEWEKEEICLVSVIPSLSARFFWECLHLLWFPLIRVYFWGDFRNRRSLSYCSALNFLWPSDGGGGGGGGGWCRSE